MQRYVFDRYPLSEREFDALLDDLASGNAHSGSMHIASGLAEPDVVEIEAIMVELEALRPSLAFRRGGIDLMEAPPEVAGAFVHLNALASQLAWKQGSHDH